LLNLDWQIEARNTPRHQWPPHWVYADLADYFGNQDAVSLRAMARYWALTIGIATFIAAAVSAPSCDEDGFRCVEPAPGANALGFVLTLAIGGGVIGALQIRSRLASALRTSAMRGYWVGQEDRGAFWVPVVRQMLFGAVVLNIGLRLAWSALESSSAVPSTILGFVKAGAAAGSWPVFGLAAVMLGGIVVSTHWLIRHPRRVKPSSE
jgi:hypothetical protein